MHSRPVISQALHLFAVDLDPQHAASHAKLAQCLQDSAFFEYLKPVDIDSRARAAATTAVQLDDRLAEAHVALGGVNYYLGFDAISAEREYLKALELNPNSIDALLHLAWFYSQAGRFDEAIGPALRAVELDPLATATFVTLGQVYYLNRDYDRAIQELEKALELDRNDPSVHYYLAWSIRQKGQHDKAVNLLEYATELSDGAPLYKSALGHAYGVAGMQQEALQILEELERKPHTSAYNLAVVHLGLGNHEQAMDWLEKAFEARNVPLVYIKKGPIFDPLRDDMRFISLLEQMGL